MINRLLTTTAIVAALAVPAAFAQTTAPAPKPAAQAQAPMAKSSFQFVTAQAPEDWSAEALIGRTVENDNGDDLGEINNVILSENGEVKAVVIGVGGFLGIGEKDVGVPFSALRFEPAKTTTSSTTTTTTTTTAKTPAPGADRPMTNTDRPMTENRDQAARTPAPGAAAPANPPAAGTTSNNQTAQRPMTTPTAPATPPAAGTTTTTQVDNSDARWDAEHDDMIIKLSATKEQLESAPEFAWLGDDANPAPAPATGTAPARTPAR